MDIDTFVPVSAIIFTRSFAVVLGLISTFRTKVHSSLGDRTFLNGMTAAWYILCTDERGTFRHLEIAPKDEPDFWGSTIIFSDVLAEFFGFYHDVKQRGTEFEGRP